MEQSKESTICATLVLRVPKLCVERRNANFVETFYDLLIW